MQTALSKMTGPNAGQNRLFSLFSCFYRGRPSPRSYLPERLGHPHEAGIFRIGSDHEIESPTHLQHGGVFAQNFADQLADVTLARYLDQSRHQEITEPAPLPVAAHLDRVFGLAVIRIRREARHPEDLIGVGRKRD